MYTIDLPGGILDKALDYYFKKLLADYNYQFYMWRVINFKSGVGDLKTVPAKSNKDPILDLIYKGTEVIEEESTVKKSYERRIEKKKVEMAENILSKKVSKVHTLKNSMNKVININKRGRFA